MWTPGLCGEVLQGATQLAGLTQRGKTVVYVTHERELAARAGSRIELLDGRIIGQQNADAAITQAAEVE